MFDGCLDFFCYLIQSYSWVDLKINRKANFYLYRKNFFEPVSRFWFERTSFLLKKGFFSYSSFNSSLRKKSFNYRKRFLEVLKLKIIENAFLLILKSYFFARISLQSMNLTECVRLFRIIFVF
jgi:hypothetical protein